MYSFIRGIVIFLYYLTFWPKIIGKKNIPKKGRIILAGNHTSNFDWGLLIIATKRQVHFLAKKELFKSKILSFFLNKFGIIPVDRKRKNKEALDTAIKYLSEERLIALFPEATTNKMKETVILPFKIGAIKMANDTDTKIVPFTIKGGFIPIFKRPIIEFYEPFKVKSTDLEKENKKFMDLIEKKLKE